MKKVFIFGISLVLIGIFFSCTSSNNKKINVSITRCDSWANVRKNKEEFTIKNDGITPMETYSTGTFVINAKLVCREETKTVKLIVDTGAIQNLISSKILNSFTNLNSSGNTFMLSGSFVEPGKSTNSKGYIFDSLETEGFISKNIMFQEIYLDNCGYTESGEVVDGVIGMDVLRNKPFKISPGDKTLTFFDSSKNFPKENKIQLNKKNIPFRLESKIKFNDNINTNVVFDTGAMESYLPYKKFCKINNLETHVIQKYKNISIHYALIKDFQFINQKIDFIPIVSNQQKMDFSSIGTIGMYVFRNFDLYVDTDNCNLVLEKRELNYPKKTLSYVVGGDYLMNGISIDKERTMNQYKITMIASVNNKPVYENIQLNDIVLKIDEKNPDEIDWENWYDIKQCTLLLQRGEQIFEEKIYRHEFIFGPMF